MRVKLLDGKQRALIEQVKNKNNFNFKELSTFLRVNGAALREWYYERCLLPYNIFRKLDEEKNFEKFIMEIREQNWGQRDGGKKSYGNTKKIKKPLFDERLAELVGILLGDGNIYSYRNVKNGKVISTHSIRICGDSRNDHEYVTEHVSNLLQNLFEIKTRLYKSKKRNAVYVIADGIELVKFFNSFGLKPGNKIKNNLTIPEWIWQDPVFLKSCIRGLFDTDGSIYELKPHWPGLIQISFRNYNKLLLKDVERALKQLGFITSKIHDKKICITKQNEVDKFFKEIKPNNPKHVKKYEKIRSPVV
jgi:hypothetical protein